VLDIYHYIFHCLAVEAEYMINGARTGLIGKRGVLHMNDSPTDPPL
jgi:hypothetical protein